MKYLNIVGSEQNLYVSVKILWPEMLFNVFSLNHIIKEYSNREQAYNWDANIATVRKLQSIILNLVQTTVTENLFKAFKKWGNYNEIFDYAFYANFYGQYIDYLNNKWLRMDRENV